MSIELRYSLCLHLLHVISYLNVIPILTFKLLHANTWLFWKESFGKMFIFFLNSLTFCFPHILIQSFRSLPIITVAWNKLRFVSFWNFTSFPLTDFNKFQEKLLIFFVDCYWPLIVSEFKMLVFVPIKSIGNIGWIILKGCSSFGNVV